MALGAAGVAQKLNVLLSVAEGLMLTKQRYMDRKCQEATLLEEAVQSALPPTPGRASINAKAREAKEDGLQLPASPLSPKPRPVGTKG